jgi:hypothetical protein
MCCHIWDCSSQGRPFHVVIDLTHVKKVKGGHEYTKSYMALSDRNFFVAGMVVIHDFLLGY